jgi:gliding motility-associated-like protein
MLNIFRFIFFLITINLTLGLVAQTVTNDHGNFTGCTGGIQLYTFDFTAISGDVINANIGVTNSLNICCGYSNNPSNSGCIYLDIIVEPGTLGVSFGLGGATGGTSIYYNVCVPVNQTYAAGDQICFDPAAATIDPVTGNETHRFMFCRSGATTYNLTITQISPSFPEDLSVSEGCTIPLSVTDLNPSSVVWNTIAPGAPGEWNHLLSCTSGCLNTVLSPIVGSPSSITIEVCGSLPGACSNAVYCSESTVSIFPDLFADAGEDVAFCLGSTIAVTATGTAIGGAPPYTYTWTGISGDGTGFTYSITTSSSTATVDFTQTGVYELTIVDVNNCATGTDFIEVFEFETDIEAYIPSGNVSVCYTPTPVITIDGYVTETFTGDWSSSNGGTFGSVSINSPNAQSGIGPSVSTTWSPDAGTTGTVTLTLTPTNNAGCPITPASITVDLTDFTSALAVSTTDIDCFGADNGEIELTITLGNPAYDTGSTEWYFEGNLISADQNLTGLAPGTYEVVVTDVNGCVGTIGATILEPTPVTSVAAVTSNYNGFGVSCHPSSGTNNDGITSGTPGGGAGGYTFEWNTVPVSAVVSTDQNPTGLTPGDYTVTVTDANGCSTTSALVTVTEPPIVTSVAAVTSDYNGFGVTCFGASDGSLSSTPGGGVGGYTYSWDTDPSTGVVSTSQNPTGLPAGDYVVTVTDANGCVATSTPVTITEPTPVTSVAAVTSDYNGFGVSCHPSSGTNNDGTTSGTPGGGAGGYTYEWNTVPVSSVVSTDQNPTGLTPGDYTVTVTDANGCSTTSALVTVTEPPIVTSVAAVTSDYNGFGVTCFGASDGSLSSTPGGGVGSYTYSWDTDPSTGVVSTSQNPTGLPAGDYVVTVTDANGCVATSTPVTITEPTPVTSVAAVTSDYNGFGVSCHPSSGTNNDGTTSGTPGGGAGGYTYEWNTVPVSSVVSTDQNPTGLTPGDYTVTVTDANGCSTTSALVTVTEPPIVTSVAAVTSDYNGFGVTCFGASDGSLSSTPGGGVGGYTYSWDTDPSTGVVSTDQNPTGLPAGDYVVTVTDANGCVATSTPVTITEPTPVTSVAAVTSDYNGFGVSCHPSSGTNNDGTTSGTPGGGAGGYTYEWNTVPVSSVVSTDQNPTGLTPGDYTVTVTDANGCSTTSVLVTVTEPPIVTSVAAVTSDYNGFGVTCFGASDGSLSSTPGGGVGSYTYSWDTDPSTGVVSTSQNPTGLPAGDYVVTVTDANGCVATSTPVTITEPTPVTSVAAVTSDYNGFGVSCHPSSGTNNDGTTSGTPGGGAGGYTYEWNTVPVSSVVSTDQNPTGLTPGDYTVTVTDANGCSTTSALVTVTEPPIVTSVAAVTSDYNGFGVTCFGASDGSLSSTPGGGVGGYTYSWDTDPSTGVVSTDQNPTGLPAGDYVVTVTDANGCVATSTPVTITEPTPVTSVAAVTSDYNGFGVSCHPSSGTNNDGTTSGTPGGGAGGYTYEWNTVPVSSVVSMDQNPTGLTPGDYTVTVTDANGCSTTSLLVTVTEPPIVTSVAAVTSDYNGFGVTCFGASDGSLSSTPGGGVGGYTYSWDTDPSTGVVSTSQYPTGLPAGDYVVTVTDANGCVATSTPVTITEPTPVTSVAAVTSDYNGFGVSCGEITTGPVNNGEINVTPDGGTPGYSYQWTTVDGLIPAGEETSQSPTGLIAGTYEVIVTDANGCTSSTQIEVTDPEVFSLDEITPSIYTGGFNLSGCDPDGAITLEVSGGVEPYSYSWNGGAYTTSDISDLPAGEYSVVVTDANNCQVTGSITLTEPSGLTSDISAFEYLSGTNISCFGLSDGSITLVVNGGTPDYTFLWSNGATTQNLNGVPAGDYQVTITDANGCEIVNNITLTEPDPLTQTISAFEYPSGTNISCFGLSDGSIDLTIGGGNPDYSYTWNNGGTTEDISGLPAGDYDVTVTDINGCVITSAITLIEPEILAQTISAFEYPSGTNISCFGLSDGSIDLTITGGNPDYTYTWDNGATTEDLSDLPAGEYNVEVEDINGCIITSTITLIEPEELTQTISAFEYPSGTNISCFGLSDGSIDLTITGGNPIYTYTWDNGSTSEDLTNIPAGEYNVEVEDINGCVITSTITLTEPDALTQTISAFEYPSGTNISCFGFSDGSIDLTITGGNPDYSYTWNNGGTTEDISGLPAGEYEVTVTDINGCEITSTITLIEPTELTSGLDVSVYEGGFNLSGCVPDGWIDLTINGGNPDYTIEWSNGSSAEDLSDLPAGDYEVTVTDINGCVTTQSITLTEPSGLTSDISAFEYLSGTNISCFGLSDGSITLVVNGGTPDYTFLWSNGATTQNLNGVPAGDYQVTITDANGCEIVNNITLTEPDALTQTISAFEYPSGTNISCFGLSDGSIDLTIGGGNPDYSYTWNNGGTTEDISGLPAGDYDVTVTDINGCEITSAITLIEPEILAQTIGAFEYPSGTNISCFGLSDGSIDLTITGGNPDYTYTWDNGATTEDLSDLPAGEYNVEVEDINGCIITSTITLIEPEELTQTISAFEYPSGTNISCFGLSDGSIDLTITGGNPIYTYTWDNGSTSEDLTNIPAGEYNVEVEDINGCVITSTITLTEPDALTQTISAFEYPSGTNISCFGFSDGSIDLTITGGNPDYSYTWNNGGTTEDISGLPAGEYEVTVTDINGCEITSTITLIEPTELTSGLDVSVYEGGFNLSGCVPDGWIDLTINGGNPDYTIEWSNGSSAEDLSDLPAGDYEVTVTDINGCVTTQSITLTEPSGLTSDISAFEYLSGTNISCFGLSDGSITLVVNGGTPDYTFLWSNGATTQNLNGVPAGDYQVTITDANGCEIVNNITLTEPDALTQTISAFEYPSGTNISCFGLSDGSIDLTIGGGNPDYSYTWNNGGTTEDISGLPAGDYDVTVTDINGCEITSAITLIEPEILAQTIGAFEYPSGTNISCFGLSDGSIDLTITGGNPDYTYSWNNGGTTEDISGIPAGDYDVTVTDINGCVITSTISLDEPDPLQEQLVAFEYVGGWNVSCNGASDGSINLTPSGGSPGYTFEWSTGATTEDITDLTAGDYEVTITDLNGCQITGTITLNEPPVLGETISAITYVGGWNVSCNGASDGQIDLEITGGTPGYTYDWNTGATSQNLVNVNIGVYSVTATDANGCQISTEITLTEPPVLTETISAQTYVGNWNVSCNGATDGAIDVTIGGGTPGYTYEWSNGALTEDITGVGAGLYEVTATDANGCQISTSITLIEPEILIVSPAVTSNYNGYDVSCEGASDGSLFATVTGGTSGYVYTWTNSNGTVISNLPNVNNLPVGTYTISITDQNGCTTSQNIDINEPGVISLNPSLLVEYNGYGVSCFGATDGSVGIDFGGGVPPYTIVWTNANNNVIGGGNTLNNLGAGIYNVLLTDANGCQFEDQIEVTQPELLQSSASVTSNYNGQDISCHNATDGAVTVSFNGGTPNYTYTWTNASGQVVGNGQNLTNIGSGTYNVLIVDANGCQTASSVTVNEPGPLFANLEALTDYFGMPVSCVGQEDGTIQVDFGGGTAGYTIVWQDFPGNTNQNPLTDIGIGQYVVVIFDANGCQVSDQIALDAHPLPVFTPSTPYRVCLGDVIEISCITDPVNSVNWSLSNGLTGAGCQLDAFPANWIGCIDATVIITTPFGCTSEFTYNDYICVDPLPNPNFWAQPSNPSFITPTTMFTNTSTGAVSYEWNFGDGSSNVYTTDAQHTFPDAGPGKYTVTLIATSEYGCVDSISMPINVISELIFYVPNAFTPDGDDHNNVFKPVFYSGYDPYDYTLLIFNRWGEVIFESRNTEVGWDGTYGSMPVQDGVYIWKITVGNLEDAKRIEKIGHVTLMR